MSDKEKLLSELTDDTDSSKKGAQSGLGVPINPFSGIGRVLSEDDLDSPGIKKLILSEIDKLQNRVEELELVESKYHILDKRNAVLEGKIQKNGSFEILYSFCLTIGSALAGISGVFWETKGVILMVIGLVLIAGGIAAKIVRK